MNTSSTTTPKRVTADWEYDERRFESEANFIPNPIHLVRDGGSFLADAGSAIGELFTEDILAKPESSKTQIGDQTELRFNNPQEAQQAQNNRRIMDQQKTTALEQAEVRSKESQKRARAQQIENVNKMIGIKNTSYEGTVNENGELRVDVQTYFEQANSALSEQEIKTQRQNQIAQVTGKQADVMGENELLKGGENFGHFTKATG